MEKSLDFLKQYIIDNDTVVCATSGGSDSMVLLSLLILLKNDIDFKIICAHVNHSLREESIEEYEFVKGFCINNNVIFEGTKFDNYNGNTEAEAHRKRYEFFDSLVNKYNASYLLTAHHGDDLIESILMKLTRGSSLDGYIGFDYTVEKDSYKILRPLIFYSKNEIRNYAKENNIEYRDDKTNYSDEYTRNRYRKYVLPFLKNENKNVHLKYLKFSNELKENNEFINRLIDEEYKNTVDNFKIDINKLLKLDIFVIKRIISKYLFNIYKEDLNLIEDKHIDFIMEVINSRRPNLFINLPNNIVLQKNYGFINLYNENNKDDYKIELKDRVIVPYGEIKLVENTNLTNNYVCFLNSKDIKLPLYIRNKKDGDKITLLGLEKDKKLKDIFINEKISIEERNNYPIVVDSNDTILWVPGLKKSKYDAIKTGKYDIILWYDKEES